MQLNIITNNAMRAIGEHRNRLARGSDGSVVAIISRLDKLLSLPDFSPIAIVDYRTGKGAECICEVARGLVKRGIFVEVKL